MKPFKTNCLFFALRLYLKHGGYLVFRKSRLDCIFPHVIWVKDLKDAELQQFIPIDHTPMKIPPLTFLGTIKYHDRPGED